MDMTAGTDEVFERRLELDACCLVFDVVLTKLPTADRLGAARVKAWHAIDQVVEKEAT